MKAQNTKEIMEREWKLHGVAMSAFETAGKIHKRFPNKKAALDCVNNFIRQKKKELMFSKFMAGKVTTALIHALKGKCSYEFIDYSAFERQEIKERQHRSFLRQFDYQRRH